MNRTPPRGKALPLRPSADLGNGGGQGGYGSGQNGYRNDENLAPRTFGTSGQSGQMGGSQVPNGRIVLEGYRNDIINGFEPPKPRYNPVSRPHLRNGNQSPATWDGTDWMFHR
jgi:hypothetical protein